LAAALPVRAGYLWLVKKAPAHLGCGAAAPAVEQAMQVRAAAAARGLLCGADRLFAFGRPGHGQTIPHRKMRHPRLADILEALTAPPWFRPWIFVHTSYHWDVATWDVTIIRKKGQRLGTVGAADERAAIAKAIEDYNIPPALQSKLALTKIQNTEKKRR
jgi:hypothetical protein